LSWKDKWCAKDSFKRRQVYELMGAMEGKKEQGNTCEPLRRGTKQPALRVTLRPGENVPQDNWIEDEKQ
jgi:hypothetical protein